MKEIVENNDELKALIREEGLLSPSPDFTKLVMHLVKDYEIKTNQGYQPLLSKKAWVAISGFVLVLVLFSWWALSGKTPGSAVYPSLVEPVAEFFTNLDFSVHINPGILMLAGIIIASVAILLSVDMVLSQKYRRLSA
jgi:hypothetical protein